MVSLQLNNALNIFKDEVAHIYKKHEETFDLESFHGRFHIIRCLLLADLMYSYYKKHKVTIDIEKSFYAILFHDSKRQDNGEDLWEFESSKLCYKYLSRKGFDSEYAYKTSIMILKDNDKLLEEQILYDVDVLDYNRFFYLPEERHRFKEYLIKFGWHYDVSGCKDIVARKEVIRIAQELVIFSQTLKVETPTDILVKAFTDYYMIIKPW
jgi:hypothetical protein